MRTKRIINKKYKKKADKKCYFCPCNEYILLDVHRIVPGENGGEYTEANTVTVCCACHRKITNGKIVILGRYFCTSGKYVIHYRDEDGQEKWL